MARHHRLVVSHVEEGIPEVTIMTRLPLCLLHVPVFLVAVLQPGRAVQSSSKLHSPGWPSRLKCSCRRVARPMHTTGMSLGCLQVWRDLEQGAALTACTFSWNGPLMVLTSACTF